MFVIFTEFELSLFHFRVCKNFCAKCVLLVTRCLCFAKVDPSFGHHMFLFFLASDYILILTIYILRPKCLVLV